MIQLCALQHDERIPILTALANSSSQVNDRGWRVYSRAADQMPAAVHKLWRAFFLGHEDRSLRGR